MNLQPEKDTSGQSYGGLKGALVAPLATAIQADPAILENILERSLHGETLRQIAPDYGVTHQALQKQLIRHVPDKWRDNQAAKSMIEYEENKAKLRAAQDQVAIARAREEVRSSQWELERLIPRLYGQKQEVTHTHKVDLETAIQAAERRIRAISASAAIEQPAIEHEQPIE